METLFSYGYINARIGPHMRGELFEDPLHDALSERGIGEVTGGGTLQSKEGEILHCGIDLELMADESTFDFVCRFLTDGGAPKGSKLQFERNGKAVELAFGNREGIGVYLNGTDLDDEVYRTSDINVVMETFAELTDDIREFNGYWQGPRETALYLYGRSASDLASRIAPFLSQYPLCQKARVVQIA